MNLFDEAAGHILALGEVTVKPYKTQVSYYGRRVFAVLSPGPRKGTVRLTFVLRRQADDERFERVVHTRAGFWTFHVVISDPADLDEQIDEWLREAYFFTGMRGSI